MLFITQNAIAMKTKVGNFVRLVMPVLIMLTLAPFAMAEGSANEVYLSGTSSSAAGDYIVQTTDEVFHYMGREYEVFEVFYDNPEMNMSIAVNTEGPCTSFVAYNNEYMFFYLCNKYGFGVRKVMFSNPWVKDGFNHIEYQEQSVLLDKKKVEKKQAVGLIASYVPLMKG